MAKDKDEQPPERFLALETASVEQAEKIAALETKVTALEAVVARLVPPAAVVPAEVAPSAPGPGFKVHA